MQVFLYDFFALDNILYYQTKNIKLILVKLLCKVQK